MNNPNYSLFSSEVSSGTAGHSTMYEPDYTHFQLSAEQMTAPTTAVVKEEPHYDSDEYYDEKGLKVEQTDYDMEWIASEEQPDEPMDNMFSRQSDLHPGYMWEDMNPTVRDPKCTIRSRVAYFWPVYVNNFRCVAGGKLMDCVKEYFASKGLHARWCIHQLQGPFYQFQTKSGLFDLLVYFVSEQDANFAIKNCHRDTYRGYTLNVFPGRIPVYFDPDRSLQIKKHSTTRVYSEQFFEATVKTINPTIRIACTVKFSLLAGAMEFASAGDMQQVQNGMWNFKVQRVVNPLQKQRFLEHDLLTEINMRLMTNPRLLKINQQDWFAQKLMMIGGGKRLQVPKPIAPVNSSKQKLKEQQRSFIIRRLTEGRRPYCYSKNRAVKTQFYQLLRQIKKDLAEGKAYL